MIRFVKWACAALAAALVVSCSSSGTATTGTSADAICSGKAVGYWATASGQADVAQADLDELAEMNACANVDPYETAEELRAYLEAAGEPDADDGRLLCAEWFAFVLNARHGLFACEGEDVRFTMGDASYTRAELRDAMEVAAEDGVNAAALREFLARANAGANVCVCTATGATGGTGGTGASGM